MVMQTAASPPHVCSGPLIVEKAVGVLGRLLQVGGRVPVLYALWPLSLRVLSVWKLPGWGLLCLHGPVTRGRGRYARMLPLEAAGQVAGAEWGSLLLHAVPRPGTNVWGPHWLAHT